MHRGFYYKWKCARDHAGAEVHPGHGEHRGSSEKAGWYAGGRGGHFGVRRPLRFMAQRLELDDEQVQVLAKILNTLKTERAQGSVDEQRSVNDIADALDAESFDSAKATAALGIRVDSAQRLQQAVFKALEETHAMLNPEQRAKLAYMLRSGQLTI